MAVINQTKRNASREAIKRRIQANPIKPKGRFKLLEALRKRAEA